MEKILRPSSYVPYDPGAYVLCHSEGQGNNPIDTCGVHPFEYTGWWNEMLASHETCYIHAGLNPSGTYKIKGPDCIKMLSDICVNRFDNFRIGTGKHGVMCNEEGYIVKDGMVLRLSDDEFITFWMWPYLEFAAKDKGYDVQGEAIAGEWFFYQLAGPASKDIVEAATGEDFSDLKFSNFKYSKIGDKKVMVLRMGMAGSLAYEVHGNAEDALYVYDALLKAGEPFGMRKIGRHTYRNVHTEGGFPQLGMHFLPANSPEYVDYMKECNLWGGAPLYLSGSMGDDKTKRYVTPVDLGWARLINFDHDFPGKEALRKLVEKPTRNPITLIWNDEDIMDVWHSIFEDGEPYALMDTVEDFSYSRGTYDQHADKIMVGDKEIGFCSGRMFSPNSRVMISTAFIDPEYCVPGKDVEIIWGEPGKRQKRIRAKTAAHPFVNTGGHAPAEKK